MKNPVFTGAGVAIITPMYEDGSINFDELGRIVEDQIARGTDAIVICGTTGECSTMTDEEQLAAIKYTVDLVNHRVPVIAGAGSGKTRVLTYKIAYLLENGYNPWNILALTFTNKAAREMKERIARQVGEQRARFLWMGTFHSVFSRILRAEASHIGFTSQFTIYDSADSKSLIRSIIKEMGLDEKTYKPGSVQARISNAKNHLVSPSGYAANKEAYEGDLAAKMPAIRDIYSRYWERCRQAGAMDFDDLLVYTYILFRDFPDVLARYREQFRYVLVDEYQDTNYAQHSIVLQLTKENQRVCVVGDDAQSIYSFRGADIDNILYFTKIYPDTKVFKLEQNYRSTQNILDAANAVIKNNTGRKGKTLWTDAGAGDRVLIKTVFNEQDEANFVVSSIMMDYNRGRNWKENAILYRMNAQSNALEYAFKRNGVPYQVVGGTKFFERAEVKDMLAYLAVINNPSDDLRLRRIINNPPRGIGNTTIERVQDLASEQGVPMMAVLQHAGEYAVLKSAAGKLERFAQLIAALREMADTMELAEFYDAVCEQTSYVRTLQEKGDVESRGRLENVQELKSNIVSFLENDPEDATLSGFLNEIALYTDLDSATSDNCVTMMTMHSAKGLEFPCVYVVGVEEGIFPGERVRYNDEEVEEERRLCYVAMTRAKERLTMTCTRQRMLFGRTSVSEPSRFLEEVPSENADWVGRQAQGASGFGDTSFDEGSSYSTRGYGSYGQGAARYDSVMQRRPKSQASQKLAAQKPAASAPLLQLSSGDQIHHKTFGDGLVISVTPMGGDALLEVAFDTVGTKKLMLKTAGVHITKL